MSASFTPEEQSAVIRILHAIENGERDAAGEVETEAIEAGTVLRVVAELRATREAARARCVAIVEAWRDGNDPNGSDVAGLLATLRDSGAIS